MKKTMQQIMEEGEPLMQCAIEALRAYHTAQSDGRPADEIERLRLDAEVKFKRTSDYQLTALNQMLHTFH
ncbi:MULTISPECIES: hypothetical protein [Pseudomonas]|uniref:hypothetical protein n=1 Tax=Pseudomonas TaxID=286 RepID=UPI000C239D6B|nr:MULTISPECIES: hypothetical protein [Pseudomonas]EKT4529705.1 hypothetical protein [Pseudomonas putida]MBO2921848.1 hypothetical protein [Pseudomonas asiatica]PJI70507.1 hypothetical protein CSW00_28520 [Pseudomonas sp. MR 02]WPU59772.1 hypothetical protein SQW15_24280 [Pseudomonas asiatica]CAB5646583.1 Uncharacterised protein [Pseudomonas putida]